MRVHLDEVEGPGCFIEFEAVLSPAIDDSQGRAQLDRLAETFSVRQADLQPESYADMLERLS